MGRLILAGIGAIAIFISSTMGTLYNRSDLYFESNSARYTEQQAQLVANYGVQYGHRILSDRFQIPNKAQFEESNPYKMTFDDTPFRINEGVLDSLVYLFTDDSLYVIIDSYVTYNDNGVSVQSTSRLIVEVPPPDEVRIGDADNALTTDGFVVVSGNSDTEGNIQSSGDIEITGSGEADSLITYTPFPAFGDVFLGMTSIEDMRAIADYVGSEPTVIEGITFIEGDFLFNNSLSETHGSGILIVDGNFSMNGNVSFEGIIWITGTLDGLGNADIIGVIFAESIGVDADGTEEYNLENNVLGNYDLGYANYGGSTFSNLEGRGIYAIKSVLQ
ncbi:hypothetical protein ACFLYK_02010 [Candidatus Cloacimonadota bacterium]